MLRQVASLHPMTYGAILLAFLFTTAGSLVSVIRYWQYDVFYYDFGFFDSAIWKVAHFQPPIIDHFALPGKIIFADHFNPSIFLLSPLFWLTKHSEMLLVVQAIAVGLSGLVLYSIGVKLLKNHVLSFAVLSCYFLFLGLQNALITDFHDVVISLLFFMLIFWAILHEKKRVFFLALILFIGCKDSNAFVGVGVSMALFFLKRSWWKIALVTSGISLLWGLLALKVIIPFFSGGHYLYDTTISLNPFVLLPTFVNSPIKVHTLLFSFWSFGFLPIFSPAFWPVIFEDFLTRFYSPDWVPRWTLAFHYSALTAAIFALSSLYSLRFITKMFSSRLFTYFLSLALLLNAVLLYRFVLHGPLALSYNKAFYAHTKDFAFLNQLIQHVPTHGSVMTSNNLAPHFIHTHQSVYLFRMNYQQFAPDYIVFDLRPGQNPNNTYGIQDQMRLFQAVSKDGLYKLFYHAGDEYIFVKK